MRWDTAGIYSPETRRASAEHLCKGQRLIPSRSSAAFAPPPSSRKGPHSLHFDVSARSIRTFDLLSVHGVHEDIFAIAYRLRFFIIGLLSKRHSADLLGEPQVDLCPRLYDRQATRPPGIKPVRISASINTLAHRQESTSQSALLGSIVATHLKFPFDTPCPPRRPSRRPHHAT